MEGKKEYRKQLRREEILWRDCCRTTNVRARFPANLTLAILRCNYFQVLVFFLNTPQNDISLYAPTQQSNVGRLSTGRDDDNPGIPPPPGGGRRGEMPYLRYDPCRPTSTCSQRWPYKIPVPTSYSTVHCVSYMTGINSCNEPSQGISNWSLVLQWYAQYCTAEAGSSP